MQQRQPPPFDQYLDVDFRGRGFALLLVQVRMWRWRAALEAPGRVLRRAAVLRFPVCNVEAAQAAGLNGFFRE